MAGTLTATCLASRGQADGPGCSEVHQRAAAVCRGFSRLSRQPGVGAPGKVRAGAWFIVLFNLSSVLITTQSAGKVLLRGKRGRVGVRSLLRVCPVFQELTSQLTAFASCGVNLVNEVNVMRESRLGLWVFLSHALWDLYEVCSWKTPLLQRASPW